MAALSAAAKIGMLSLGVGTAGLMGKITRFLETVLCQFFSNLTYAAWLNTKQCKE